MLDKHPLLSHLALNRRDRLGEDGASLLAPDELPIQLLPGPASALVADCPQQLQCSTKGVLDCLPIKAVDAYGNLVDSCSFDVSLSADCAQQEALY
jgi:hypothetical protein